MKREVFSFRYVTSLLCIIFGSIMVTGISFIILAPCARSAEIHVPIDYASIQSAINASVHGDEIVIHPGLYSENIKFSGKVITVRCTDPNDPVVIGATIIDGGGSGRVVEFSSGEESDSVLSGFTLQWGEGGIYCDGSSPTIANCFISYNRADYGGGIYCIDSSPIITDCTISYNWTLQEEGGGIYCGINSSPTIVNCDISHNSSYGDGGGIYCASSSLNIHHSNISYNRANYGGGIYCEGTLNMTDCIVSDNSSFDEGGGIYCFGMLTLSHSTINDNSSYVDGGGIHCGDASNITDCVLSNNSSDRYGGGIYCNGTLIVSNCEINNSFAHDGGGGIYCNGSVSITNSKIDENMSYGDGGGLYCGDLSTVTNCNIMNNVAYDGGGIYCYGVLKINGSDLIENTSYGDGGGLYCGDSSEMTQCNFRKNLANQGGGIYSYGLVTVINCTLSKNSSFDKGGAMYCDGGVTMTNCTVTANFADQGGGIYYDGWSTPSKITNCILWADSPDEVAGVGMTPVVSYSDIQGGVPGTNNNIVVDPLFVEPGAGDYHLRAGSPCMNTGTSNGAPIRDKEGHFRDQYPDMGAYEYMNHPPQFDPIADMNVKPGKKIQFIINATDIDGDLLTYAVDALPFGASFNPDTHLFTWIPDHRQTGSHTINFTVTDSGTPPMSDLEKVTIYVMKQQPIWTNWSWYPQGMPYTNAMAYQPKSYLWNKPISLFQRYNFSQVRYQALYQPYLYQPQSFMNYNFQKWNSNLLSLYRGFLP